MGCNSSSSSTKKPKKEAPYECRVKVVDDPDKEWWEDYTPCEDSLKQISFIASIGTGFTLSASVSLACSSSFKGATDSNTIALVASTAELFAWGGSAYAVALVASMIGILTVELKSVVRVLQKPKKLEEEEEEAKKSAEAKKLYEWHSKWFMALHYVFFNIYILLAVVSLGFTAAGTALTGIGLNTLAGGSGTMLEWSLLVVGFPMMVLAMIAIPVERHLKKLEDDKENNEEPKKLTRQSSVFIHPVNHPVLSD